MIDRLHGIVLEKKTEGLIVGIGGFGLMVHVAGPKVGAIGEGEEVDLFTYLQVKEDGFALFGFVDEKDRGLFLLLIGVSGVGPKVAMGIFDRFAADDVIYFIQNGDAKSLTEAPGIGKKTAERLLLELKDKVKGLGGEKPVRSVSANRIQGPEQEALEALESLGYSANEAREAVKGIDGENVEVILKTALRRLSVNR
ncbi:MAG: Holliday junction branch migration protein RuvA [Peptoniphilus sp.]|nr:Holliday junction branch migration protein RuvA [Peptoniphilus sp.]MDY3119198.1 Holliday junction branch migration protein RuvA [Peptoniphilus sp.]